jgi:NDP-sugar pyrophosphorylase family protein
VKAVILAGGKGTRLAPYTNVFPKPLVPVGDMPILEVVLCQLQKCGFREVTLTVGHLAALLHTYFGDGAQYGLQIDYVFEDKPLGTAGPLVFVPSLDETFLVMNGDLLTTLHYGELVRYHKERGAAATVAMHQKDVHIDLGVIQHDKDCRIVDYIEKPCYHYQVSMGVYVFEPIVLQYIPRGEYFDFPSLVHSLLDNGETIVGYPYDGYWLDIGRKDDYEQAVQDFEQQRSIFLMECVDEVADSPG